MHAKFFGYLYEKHEIHPHPSKVIVIKEMSALQNKEKLQSFLGIVTFVSPLISSLSSHTTMPRGLLKYNIAGMLHTKLYFTSSNQCV